MQQRKLFTILALIGLAAAPSLARGGRNGNETRFTVRVENLSMKDAFTASNGAKWSFVLSPGLWVAHRNDVMLFNEGKPASKGLEMQAEDCDPSGLVKMIEAPSA